MGSNFFLIGAIFVALFFLQGCNEFVGSANIAQIENKEFLKNKEMNRVIENYIDKYLSEIIRIRNFNPERVKKVFCVHHAVHTETAITAPNAIHAYVKLLCVENKNLISNNFLTSNPTGLVSKIYLQKYVKNLNQSNNQIQFKVISEETPRDTPFYLKDLHRSFSNDIIEKLSKVQFNEQLDYRLIQEKVSKYQKELKVNCQ